MGDSVDDSEEPGDVAQRALRVARPAVDADNALLLELMAQVPMSGSLVLSTQRGPDFFSLYRMQRGSAHPFLYDDGKVQGMAAALVRDGFLDGAPACVGYLGDLRIRGTSRARLAFPKLYGTHLARLQQQTGCACFLTGVLASNALAIASLAGRRRRRDDQPVYTAWRRYDMASVQLVWPRRKQAAPGLTVRTATPVDVDALAAFLAADARRRPFGYRFDDGELEHRLQRWPGFSLDDTFLVERGGKIVGACTAWDAAPVKRYRVLRYAGEMLWVKRAVRVLSSLTGCQPLPDVGADFRYAYLTNLAVDDDDPIVFRALLSHVYAHLYPRGFHFFSFPLYEDDPLAPAVAGFVVRRLPFVLYTVTTSAASVAGLDSRARPGFEMALA